MIIRSEEIYKKANSIVKSCGTRDTLKIARELGIHLHFLDNLNDLLGMYTYRHKERHILLNSNMEYLIIRAVRDDLAEMPEYAHCETAAYDWRFSPGSIWRFSPGANSTTFPKGC